MTENTASVSGGLITQPTGASPGVTGVDSDKDKALDASEAITVTAVRNVRKQRNLPAKEPLELRVIADENYHPELGALLRKTANLTDVETVAEKPANVTLCPTRDDLISLLKVSPVENSLVLVKGSHGMGLEQALEAL